MRDLPAINAYAKSKNINSKLRGNLLIIDGKPYKYADIKELPHNISIEAAKLINVADGWAYQGHHTYLSNLFASLVEVNTTDGNTEQFDCGTGICCKVCTPPQKR